MPRVCLVFSAPGRNVWLWRGSLVKSWIQRITSASGPSFWESMHKTRLSAWCIYYGVFQKRSISQMFPSNKLSVQQLSRARVSSCTVTAPFVLNAASPSVSHVHVLILTDVMYSNSSFQQVSPRLGLELGAHFPKLNVTQKGDLHILNSVDTWKSSSLFVCYSNVYLQRNNLTYPDNTSNTLLNYSKYILYPKNCFKPVWTC